MTRALIVETLLWCGIGIIVASFAVYTVGERWGR